MAISPQYTDPNSPDYNPSAAESQKRVSEHNANAQLLKRKIKTLISIISTDDILNNNPNIKPHLDNCISSLNECLTLPDTQLLF